MIKHLALFVGGGKGKKAKQKTSQEINTTREFARHLCRLVVRGSAKGLGFKSKCLLYIRFLD